MLLACSLDRADSPPEDRVCGVGLPASPVPQPRQALDFKITAAISLTMFIGLRSSFCSSFLTTHSWHLGGVGKCPAPEEHLCTNHWDTEVHTSDLSKGVEREYHLWAVLPPLEEQLPSAFMLCSKGLMT